MRFAVQTEMAAEVRRVQNAAVQIAEEDLIDQVRAGQTPEDIDISIRWPENQNPNKKKPGQTGRAF